jgi:prolipoprotein diacylglyceryltransferase
VLFGGRLGYCLFYDTRLLGLFRDDHGNVAFPYWGVLAVWRGGMAAHGGVLLTIITIIVFTWRNNVAVDRAMQPGSPAEKDKKNLTSKEISALRKYSIVNIGDAACMVVPIGLFFGRVANFINGELYGHPTTVAWAVKFPSEIQNPTNNPADLPIPIDKLDPDQILRMVAWARNNPEFAGMKFESLADLINNHVLQRAEKILQMQDADRIVQWAQTRFPDAKITDTNSLITQLQQGSANVSEMIRSKFAAMDSLPARHPSQLYEALLEGVLLFLIVWIIGRKWRRDGMASGAFLTLYPVMRIIGEQFRVGDTPVTILGMTLSKGVWYSVAMFVPGVIFWIYWIKKNRKAEWVPEPKPSKADAGN